MATPPGQYCDVKLLGLFLAGSFVMRGAGCTINDLWDKDYDRKVREGRWRGRGKGGEGASWVIQVSSSAL